MNPTELAPVVSADVSLIALFLQAHWIVKAVMLGLIGCSVWVWAIAIDKMFMYCLLYTSPSPRDGLLSRMPSSA